TEDLKHGLAFWTKKNGLEQFFLDSKKISQVHWDKGFNKFIYQKAKFNASPSIWIKERNLEERKLYQSNPKLMKYDLGYDHLVYFNTASGSQQKGIIIYPSNFDPNKKYPMITWIYEKNYKEAFRFNPPTNL